MLTEWCGVVDCHGKLSSGKKKKKHVPAVLTITFSPPFSFKFIQTSKVQPMLASRSHPTIPDYQAKWEGAGSMGRGMETTEGMLSIFLNAFQTERECQKKAKWEILKTHTTYRVKEGCWAQGKERALGKGNVSKRELKNNNNKEDKRKLTCIGDGSGKQEEVEEDVLQQYGWQKFGHPHGAAGGAGGSHWRCLGERILFRLSA